MQLSIDYYDVIFFWQILFDFLNDNFLPRCILAWNFFFITQSFIDIGSWLLRKLGKSQILEIVLPIHSYDFESWFAQNPSEPNDLCAFE